MQNLHESSGTLQHGSTVAIPSVHISASYLAFAFDDQCHVEQAPSTLGLWPTRCAYIGNLQLTWLPFNWLHPSMQPTKSELSDTGKQHALLCNLAGT